MKNLPHLIRCPIYKHKKKDFGLKQSSDLELFKVWTD